MTSCTTYSPVSCSLCHQAPSLRFPIVYWSSVPVVFSVVRHYVGQISSLCWIINSGSKQLNAGMRAACWYIISKHVRYAFFLIWLWSVNSSEFPDSKNNNGISLLRLFASSGFCINKLEKQHIPVGLIIALFSLWAYSWEWAETRCKSRYICIVQGPYITSRHITITVIKTSGLSAVQYLVCVSWGFHRFTIQNKIKKQEKRKLFITDIPTRPPLSQGQIKKWKQERGGISEGRRPRAILRRTKTFNYILHDLWPSSRLWLRDHKVPLKGRNRLSSTDTDGTSSNNLRLHLNGPLTSMWKIYKMWLMLVIILVMHGTRMLC